MLWRPPRAGLHLGVEEAFATPQARVGVDVMEEKGHVARSSACHHAPGSPPSIAPADATLWRPLRDPELLLKDPTKWLSPNYRRSPPGTTARPNRASDSRARSPRTACTRTTRSLGSAAMR